MVKIPKVLVIIILTIFMVGCSESTISIGESHVTTDITTSSSGDFRRESIQWIEFHKSGYDEEKEAIYLWYKELEVDPNLPLFPNEDSILIAECDINGDYTDEIIACFSGSSFWGRGGSLVVLGFDGSNIIWEASVVSSLYLDEADVESSLVNKIGILSDANGNIRFYINDRLWTWEDKIVYEP